MIALSNITTVRILTLYEARPATTALIADQVPEPFHSSLMNEQYNFTVLHVSSIAVFFRLCFDIAIAFGKVRQITRLSC